MILSEDRSAAESIDPVQELLNHLLSNYSKFKQPPLGNNETIHFIQIHVLIDAIFDVSEKDSSFKAIYNMELTWRDPRLRFDPFIADNQLVTGINIPTDYYKKSGVYEISF